MGDFGGNIPRVIFIGDSGVGKTSIIHRAKFGVFEAHTVPTIGAGTTTMKFESSDKSIEYQLWDTAGQEIYRNIVPIYFKGAVGAIVCFAMNDPESFKSLQSWVDQLIAHGDNNTGIVIVGNKIDTENVCVDETNARKWAQSNGYTIFFTSALTGQSVDLLLEYIESKFILPSLQSIKVTEGPIEKKKKGCC